MDIVSQESVSVRKFENQEKCLKVSSKGFKNKTWLFPCVCFDKVQNEQSCTKKTINKKLSK